MYYPSELEKKKTRIIDEIKVPTKETLVSSDTSLLVEAGTTGYKGKKSRKEGRSFIKILDAGNADIRVERNADGKGFTMRVIGDAELNSLINALDYISFTLKKQIKENKTKKEEKDKEKEKGKEKINVNSSDKFLLVTEKQKKYINGLLKKYGLKLNEKELSKKKAIKLIEELVENDKDKSKNISEEFFAYITELD